MRRDGHSSAAWSRRCLALLMAMGALTESSCFIASENSVGGDATVVVDTSPYVGSWHAITAFEKDISSTAPATLTVLQLGVNKLQIQYPVGPNNTVTEEVQLTSVGGVVVGSSKDEFGFWTILSPSVTEGGTKLSLLVPSPAVVASDVSTGVLGGTVDDWDLEYQQITVSASPTELRAYVATHPGLFSNVIMEYRRD